MSNKWVLPFGLLVAVLVVVIIISGTTKLNTKSLIENNCIETSLVTKFGKKIYDCSSINQ